MLELTRTVRFCLNGDTGEAPLRSGRNGFSAWPAMRGLGRFYQLHVTCRGEADPLTGYFINITHIDAAVHRRVIPHLEQLLATCDSPALLPMGLLMKQMLQSLQEPLRDTVVQLTLDLSPYYSLTIMRDTMDQLVMRQRYEFSAAHRLHVPGMSEADNLKTFGKCNNPAGHGHNYHLEVAIAAPMDSTGQVRPVEDLDELVSRVVLEKLDHKNLNVDVAEFAQLNPSVENIARVVHGWLAAALPAIDAKLHELKMWETEKTCCTYRG